MKYFINNVTLILIGTVFLLMCLGFLTTYIGNKQKPKAKKKKNTDPYRENPYVYAHKQMVKSLKDYEDDLADLEPDEVEDYKKRHPKPSTSTNFDVWRNSDK